MATSSPGWTTRFTPFKTRSASLPPRYSFSSCSATISGGAADRPASAGRSSGGTASLIPQHLDRIEAGRLAGRVERRQEREDQRGHRDEREVERVHPHRQDG